MAFAANHAAASSAAASEAAASFAQFIVPPAAMVAMCTVGVLLGIAGVRPHGGGGGSSKQLPMFLVKGVVEDGDVTDDEHAKQVCQILTPVAMQMVVVITRLASKTS